LIDPWSTADVLFTWLTPLVVTEGDVAAAAAVAPASNPVRVAAVPSTARDS
jgi:hypothetical protein